MNKPAISQTIVFNLQPPAFVRRFLCKNGVKYVKLAQKPKNQNKQGEQMSRWGATDALIRCINMIERDKKRREREAAMVARQQERERKQREREAIRAAKQREKELIMQNAKIQSPRQFERNVANRLNQLGFSTLLTKTTGDQGVDVLATKNNMNFAIQCKLYSHPVGNKAVQEVCAGRAFYRCDYAVVVSNADFTLSAWQCARAADVILLKDDELYKLLEYIA